MKFEEQFLLESDINSAWDILMDVHQVAQCLSGVEELNIIDDDSYRGLLQVSMGPVKLRFAGEVNVILRDRENKIAILEASAKDARARGGFSASMQMQLSPHSDTATTLLLQLETTFLGRIGELGRPLIKRKISSIMKDFALSLNAQLVTVDARTHEETNQ